MPLTGSLFRGRFGHDGFQHAGPRLAGGSRMDGPRLREVPRHAGVGRGGRGGPGVGLRVFGRWGGPRTRGHAADGQGDVPLVVSPPPASGASGPSRLGRRRLVRIKLRFGLLGIAAIAGVIGVPVAGLVAFKYFGHQRRTLPVHRGLLCFVERNPHLVGQHCPDLMSDRTLLFFDLDRTLWDFERNSLGNLEGAVCRAGPGRIAGCPFEAFNTVYQRENAACWAAYQAGTMTKPVLRGERFPPHPRCAGHRGSGVGGDDGAEYVNRGPHQRHLLDGA